VAVQPFSSGLRVAAERQGSETGLDALSEAASCLVTDVGSYN